MPKQSKNQEPEVQEEEAQAGVEEEFTLDMTQAKTFEPLPTDRPYLVAVSAWKPGRTAPKEGAPNGNRKLHYEVSVIEPAEFKNRKVIVDQSLDEEYNLGRLLTMLITGFEFPEKEVKSPKFQLPKAEDMVGQQAVIFVRTESNEAYGDRSRIRRWAPASTYKAPGKAGSV